MSFLIISYKNLYSKQYGMAWEKLYIITGNTSITNFSISNASKNQYWHCLFLSILIAYHTIRMRKIEILT